MDHRHSPGENDSKAKTKVTKARLWVDSRDRDVTTYPVANDFKVTLATPLRAVSSITLTDFRVPIVTDTNGAFYYCALALKNVAGNTLLQLKEDGSWPAGTLAIIPLIPAEGLGGTYAYYRNTNTKRSPSGWRVKFPQALGQLSELRFEILAWGGGTGWGGPTVTTMLYPLASEAQSMTSDMGKNVLIGLEVEHHCQ